VDRHPSKPPFCPWPLGWCAAVALNRATAVASAMRHLHRRRTRHRLRRVTVTPGAGVGSPNAALFFTIRPPRCGQRRRQDLREQYPRFADDWSATRARCGAHSRPNESLTVVMPDWSNVHRPGVKGEGPQESKKAN